MTAQTLESAPVLEIARVFDASPEQVFDAWTSPQWCAWLPPAHATCELVSQTAVTGGAYHVRMTMPDGRVLDFNGRYLEVARPTHLSMTWIGSYNDQESVISVAFEPRGAGTLMTLVQKGLLDPQLHEGYRQGWSGEGGSFDKLARVLADGGR